MNSKTILLQTLAFRGRSRDTANMDQCLRKQGWNGVGDHPQVIQFLEQ